MKRLAIGLIACCSIISSNAQTQKAAWQSYILPQAALVNGDHAVSAQVQVNAGMQKKNWMFGIGAALDYYKVRTCPVFAETRFAFGKNQNFFSYANLGINIAWALESEYTPGAWGTNRIDRFNNGVYTDMGIGYATKGLKKGTVMIGIGYSLKTVSSTSSEAIYRDFPPYGIEYVDKRSDYTLNRLALRLGVRL